ncbi:MAG: class I SAM-dependent methyltransferase [Alphaproteobacteria bacterium]
MAPGSDNNDDRAPTDGVEISHIEERNALLKDIPYEIVRQGWFTLSHMLLNPEARVAHLGCGDGRLTYAMAALRPEVTFLGVNKSKKAVREASKAYQLDNLSFEMGDTSGEVFDEDSLDAIINSFTLHEIYSEARYNQRIVSDTLRKQFSMLKNGGLMFIQDYTKPSDSDFVLMEMHDEPSHGEALSELSEADLLVWYSEHAQPKQNPGCGGFFLEELPPRFPRTRLFRLPYKWAYEFIMRKDSRDLWEHTLPFEFTYFTVDEFRRELHSLGAQMLYSAPHWNEDYIRKNFEGHFRLMHVNGEALGDPPTSFVSVSRKRPERTSLSVKERRLTQEEINRLQIRAMRNNVDGKILDVVTRDKELVEVFPYRIDHKGRIFVYFHDGIIRGLSNAVARNGDNIDGREWSGHMLEAISVDSVAIKGIDETSHSDAQNFIKSYTGLDLEEKALLEAGATYYPDPNYIDERVHSYFVRVEDQEKQLEPPPSLLEDYAFTEKGVLRELNAQSVLDAIAVGLIPYSRLELQILSLMQHIGAKAENWLRKDIYIATSRIIEEFNIKDFFKLLNQTDTRFKDIKGTAGQLRTVNSIFVEEGQNQGGYTGIAAQTQDFVISDEKTINTAVILPISKSMKGDIHAGFLVQHMPVPQRFEGNGLSLSAPQYNIPKDVKNHRQLKQFVAEKMGVKPNMVLKLGESYYTHIGITPQRVHPFAVFAPPGGFKGVKFMPIMRYMKHWKSLSKQQHFLTVLARSYRFLPDHMKLQAKRDVKVILKDVIEATRPDWSPPMPLSDAGVTQSRGAGATGKQKDKGKQNQDVPESKPQDHADLSRDKDPSQDQDSDKDTGSSEGKNAAAAQSRQKQSFLEKSKKRKKAKKKKKKLGFAEGKDAKIEAAVDGDDSDAEDEQKKTQERLMEPEKDIEPLGKEQKKKPFDGGMNDDFKGYNNKKHQIDHDYDADDLDDGFDDPDFDDDPDLDEPEPK